MSQKILVIGANSHGECGVNNKTNLSELTDFNEANGDLSINNIYNGNGYTIYGDKYNNNVWSSGNNKHYSCCIVEYVDDITRPKQIECFKTGRFAKETIKKKGRRRKEGNDDEKRESVVIKKVCVNVSGYCSFFISANNVVYGNGPNRKRQLGFNKKEDEWWKYGFQYKSEPKKIQEIPKNLIDIKSSANYSLALRMSDKGIMFLYCNRNKYNKGLQLHDDVLRVIVAYVGKLTDEDCAVYMTTKYRKLWQPISQFKGRDIIKLESGEQHSLALESDGTLWSFGNNRYLQCGHLWSFNDKTVKDIKNAMEITYFKENNIIIKNIKCGWNHCLVIDKKQRVYSFGRSNFGQCGNGENGEDNDQSQQIQLIQELKDYKVNKIECGANHSYVGTVDGKHFLFGKNNQNQCVTKDMKDNTKITKPHCINKIVEEKIKGIIQKVLLGVDNTQIIVSTATNK